MIYTKLFSKNKKNHQSSLKRQNYKSPVTHALKKTTKTKTRQNENRFTVEKTASAQYVFTVLFVTAIGLMAFYYQSISVYWQQTYHSDLLESDTSFTPEISQANIISEQHKTENEESILLPEGGHSVEENIIDSPADQPIVESENSPNMTASVEPGLKDSANVQSEQKETKENDKTEIVVKIEAKINTKEVSASKEKFRPVEFYDNKSVLIHKNTPDVNRSSGSATNSRFPIILTSKDKVLFAGDSLMQGVAPYVKKMLFKQYKIEGIDLSKQSTGLAYPSAFDWPQKINETLDKDSTIKLLIVFLGPNDPWDFPVKGYNKYAKFKSELWEAQYRLRIKSILDSAQQQGVQVLWLSPPCMRKPTLNDGIVYLNSLYQSELKKANQHFLSTNELLGCTYEKFSNFIENDKEKIKVRIDDGIHFTPKGQQILAKAIMGNIVFKESNDSKSD